MEREADVVSGQELEQSFVARADFYRLLSEIYYNELTQEQIDNLDSSKFLALRSGDDAEFDEGLADISHSLKFKNAGTRQELAVDYARCIIGAGAQKGDKNVLPYESMYTGNRKQLMGDARDDVFRAFKRSRLRLAQGIDVPDDHISFMLEYLAVLTDRSLEAVRADDADELFAILRKQQAFLRDHMLNWIDEFTTDLEGMAQTRFYRGIAKLTRSFLHNEYGLVTELIEQNDGQGA